MAKPFTKRCSLYKVGWLHMVTLCAPSRVLLIKVTKLGIEQSFGEYN